MAARLLHWGNEACLLFLIWLLFVDELQAHELLVGAGASLLAATAVESVRGAEHPRFLPHFRWILASWRLPWQIVHDCVLLLRNLVDRRTGHFETIAFDASGADARSVARRALAIFYTTLPPNTIVIGIDRRRDYMLLHRLEGTP